MKHTKKALLKICYQRVVAVTLLDMEAPLRWIDRYVAENITGHGTAIDEKFLCRADYRKIVVNSRKYSKNLSFQAKILTKYTPRYFGENIAAFYDEFLIKIGKGSEQFTLNMLVSSVYQYFDDKWQIICLNASVPNTDSSADDPFHIDERNKKLKQLEELIKEKTLQVQEKNKELEIEAALERVRNKALSMKASEDLTKVVATVFENLQKLNFNLTDTAVVINVFQKDSNDIVQWITDNNQTYPRSFQHPHFDNPILNDIKKAREKRLDYFSAIYTKKVKNAFWNYYFKHTDFKAFPDKIKKDILNKNSYSQCMALQVHTGILLPNIEGRILKENEIDILKKFSIVFEQAYIRFLDLKKAEDQAKEALIEASLERVRSVAMSMHQASDLLEICETSYVELIKLGFSELRNTMINIHDDAEEKFLNYDYSKYAGKSVTKYGYNIHPVISRLVTKSRSAQDAFVDIALQGKDFEEWKNFRRTSGEQDDKRLNSINHLHYYFYSIGIGSIGISTFESISEQKLTTLKRFRNVFQLAYQRFTDLTLAEAQAREAQIETALERVRARTMAMQKSSELSAVAHILFEEFRMLNPLISQEMTRAFLLTVEEENALFKVFITRTDGIEQDSNYPLTFAEPTNGRHLYDCWHLNHSSLVRILEGKEYKSWLKYLDEIGLYVAPEVREVKRRVNHYIRFSKGFLGVTNDNVLSDEQLNLLQRFAKVFDQTYTRFIDLQIAENNAKEAIKQASLDRIRANIASMRRVEDLDRITPVIWKELSVLGITFQRCGIFIMDESSQQIHTFLSSPNGSNIAAYFMHYDETPHIFDMVSQWKNKQPYISKWDFEEFNLLADSLYSQGAIPDKSQYLQNIPEGGIYLHFIPFFQGMLYVGNVNHLSEDDLTTLALMAEAFSTAYARYEDFNKLESAKKQVEIALTNLQQAQKQLVQSEKMASLGELTAGIAHEIQNPLNFVNNFSEVSIELLEELRQELEQGNGETVTELLADIVQNLEKINHHGRRADGIVKGMLQHSRTNSGQKELVDINELCDEYLRLSYHGLRAKDKRFNAKFETHFDESISKISIVPQEMGRVILNLINNAFYAVSKMQINAEDGYIPTVVISTKVSENKLQITVQDNGLGIPENVKEKIFQPFFTTKPTGEGTGLGLSLSYDIVKAHGGELVVESEINKGTIFCITIPITR